MGALFHNGEVNIVRSCMKLTDYAIHLQSHVSQYPKTSVVEKIGKQYVANGFPIATTEEFVREVCRWGNYPGVAGKVLKANDLSVVRDYLCSAHHKITSNDPRGAIEAVTSIKCLAVSFGSKHLKFIAPDHAVVLDSVISERLGYPRDARGYADFLKDCFSIRDMLNSASIPATPKRPTWRVSDVEMAIFMSLR